MSRRCMSIDAIISTNTNYDYQTDNYLSSTKQQDQLLSPPDSTLGAPNSPPPSPIMSEASHEEPQQHKHYHAKSYLPASASLDERRHRNKIASAKYRAKKQASMKAMAAKLAQISAENAKLQQELAKVHEDNQALRNLCKSLMPQQQSSSS